MLDVYRLLANRVGTNAAEELARELSKWHDAMVRHERVLAAVGRACLGTDECPHAEAADLWMRVQQIFGEHAAELTFLRTSAEASGD